MVQPLSHGYVQNKRRFDVGGNTTERGNSFISCTTAIATVVVPLALATEKYSNSVPSEPTMTLQQRICNAETILEEWRDTKALLDSGNGINKVDK